MKTTPNWESKLGKSTNTKCSSFLKFVRFHLHSWFWLCSKRNAESLLLLPAKKKCASTSSSWVFCNEYFEFHSDFLVWNQEKGLECSASLNCTFNSQSECIHQAKEAHYFHSGNAKWFSTPTLNAIGTNEFYAACK